MRFRSAAAWQHVTTIIIVEDDCSVNLAVSRLLEAAGFGVRSFTSGNAVLADDEAREADCLVLDVHLPDMNGFDLQRQLAAAGSSAPVVVITAHDDPLHRRAAREHRRVHIPDEAILESVARGRSVARHRCAPLTSSPCPTY